MIKCFWAWHNNSNIFSPGTLTNKASGFDKIWEDQPSGGTSLVTPREVLQPEKITMLMRHFSQNSDQDKQTPEQGLRDK